MTIQNILSIWPQEDFPQDEVKEVKIYDSNNNFIGKYKIGTIPFYIMNSRIKNFYTTNNFGFCFKLE